MAPSRLLFRGPERGVTLALRREAAGSSLGGLDERGSDGVNRFGVGTPGLASLGVNGEGEADLEERLKAALRVGVKGFAGCLSVMTQAAGGSGHSEDRQQA